MRVVNLMENTDAGNGCSFEHGLSFYIETPRHKLLIDTGASDSFIGNAEKLNINLKEVDTLILSHGHYDHSGGLLAFAQLNQSARIYMRENALAEYYSMKKDGPKYIGVDKKIKELSQLVLVKGELQIDEELFLFTNVTGRKLWPDGNRLLKVKKEGSLCQDDFSHEQYLVIASGGKEVLVSGCAHNGILNILDRYKELRNRQPDAVISGFHMMKRNGYTQEDEKLITLTAKELKNYETSFYTGHCTGEEPYELMQHIMGTQINYVRSGEEIWIGKSD